MKSTELESVAPAGAEHPPGSAAAARRGM